MTPKSILAASVTAVLLSTTTLSAQTSNDAVNAAIAELQDAGYMRIEVQIRNGGYRIEATGADGSVERTFDRDGNLVREEVVSGGIETETTYDANGNVIETETGPAYDDDDRDDDDGRDDDDDDDDNSGHGNDDDDDDDRDDDRDDDDRDDDNDDDNDNDDDDDDDDDDHGGHGSDDVNDDH